MKITELYSDVITENTEYEFKSKLSEDNPVRWAKTIVGFANGNGGIMFVGVSDEREVFGLDLDEIDRTKNLIALVNDRHVFPHVKVSYMMRNADLNAEKFVLAVKVYPSDSVVRYRDGDFNEKVYVKGDANATPASPEDIISLSRKKYGIDNERTEILYNLDEWRYYNELCQEYREDGTTPTLKELQNEEIVTLDGLSKSGLLMFKDDYNGDETLICCRLWKGKTKTGVVLDRDKFKGSLAKALSDTLNFIERNTKSGWRKTTYGGREEIRSYPKEAVREALVNAIAHRDYSIYGTQIDVDIYDDRIDIVSPGSWMLPRKYEEYTIGTIPSIRRNTIIAACLDVANLMERSGTGFKTIIESYEDCDESRQPGVLIYPGFLILRLPDKLYKTESTNEYEYLTVEELMLELLKDGPKSVKELQAATKYNARSSFLEEVINPLLESGKIIRVGNPKSPSSKFYLNKEDN